MISRLEETLVPDQSQKIVVGGGKGEALPTIKFKKVSVESQHGNYELNEAEAMDEDVDELDQYYDDEYYVQEDDGGYYADYELEDTVEEYAEQAYGTGYNTGYADGVWECGYLSGYLEASAYAFESKYDDLYYHYYDDLEWEDEGHFGALADGEYQAEEEFQDDGDVEESGVDLELAKELGLCESEDSGDYEDEMEQVLEMDAIAYAKFLKGGGAEAEMAVDSVDLNKE